jgi:rhamnosyltransferase
MKLRSNIINSLAIIVVFNPLVGHVRKLVSRLCEQGVSVLLVDNSNKPISLKKSSRIHFYYIFNNGNYGVGQALNTGMKFGLERGFENFFCFDQDSNIGAGFVDNMLGARCPGSMVVTPQIVDQKTNVKIPFLAISRKGLPYYHCGEDAEFKLAITSGILIDAQIIKNGNFFNEELFLDYVDLEWFFRLRFERYNVCHCTSATVFHQIGVKTIKIGKIESYAHSPSRTFYKIRNPIMLFGFRHIPLLYALHELASCLKLMVLHVFIGPNRILYLKNACLGSFAGCVWLAKSRF